MNFTAPELWAGGFVDLVPVIPPGATIAPNSAIPVASIGKVPGKRSASGVWTGLPWQKYRATADDVQAWQAYGASTGLKADAFPGLDVDCTDEGLSKIIVDFALAKLGPAPIRTGRAPKRLLMFKASEPFSRMRLWVKKDGVQHLVEVLGRGNQYLVAGTHPATLKPYEWNERPQIEKLSEITSDKVALFFDELGAMLGMIYDVEVSREGDGRIIERAAVNEQTSLWAPSIGVLREAVKLIPNDYDSRDEWIKVGYAIRAAAGEDVDEGFNIFAEWSDRWTGGSNAPETVRADWRRLRPPFSVGWNWLAELARSHGYNDAADAFPPLAPAPEDVTPDAIVRSDQWLTDEILAERSAELRYAAEAGKWYVWSGSMWAPDATMAAEDIINTEMVKIADKIVRYGATPAEKRQAQVDAIQICSGGKASAVRNIMKSRRAIAIAVEAFDADPWIINTPSCMIDLRTGEPLPSDPDALCSKSTSVGPNFSAKPERWLAFLDEACGGDQELVSYMKRWCGYILTGSTREQAFGYLIGEGGNGKGVFFRVLSGVLADYAKTATLDAFTAATGDRHSTDLAALEGARLVTSSEAQPTKSWDVQRIKAITGEDKISARLMHKDNRTFEPQFKMLFAGNSLPVLHTVDKAMKRRLQVIPFTVTPKKIDGELGLKLKAEYPEILAWMIEGCLEWQRVGLNPPETVLAHTTQYFLDQDLVGQFLKDETEPGGWTRSGDVYRRYVEWANREQGGAKTTAQWFGQKMTAKGIERTRRPEGNVYNLSLKPSHELGG